MLIHPQTTQISITPETPWRPKLRLEGFWTIPASSKQKKPTETTPRRPTSHLADRQSGSSSAWGLSSVAASLVFPFQERQVLAWQLPPFQQKRQEGAFSASLANPV